MKVRLGLVNISLLLYLAGLFTTIGIGMKAGLVFILIAVALIAGSYFYYSIRAFAEKKFCSLTTLLITLTVFALTVLFIHGFTTTIMWPFWPYVSYFKPVYLTTGFLIVGLFLFISVKFLLEIENRESRLILIVVVSIGSLVSLIGILGMLEIISVSFGFLIYGIGVVLLAYMFFGIKSYYSANNQRKSDYRIIIFTSAVLIIFIFIKYFLSYFIPNGLFKASIYLGFIPLLILPFTIIFVKKYHFVTVLIFYIVLVDFYLIQLDKSYWYLLYYGVNKTPEVSISEIIKEPTPEELQSIIEEWSKKDFSPKQVKIEYSALRDNGDSIKVVSHFIDGNRHYGIIRIPNGLNSSEAPILVNLVGGGTSLDIVGEHVLYSTINKDCDELLDRFITIAPSFRGDLIKGKDYLFLSGGNEGDAIIGAAEDAISFLEVVKELYHKDENTRVLAYGSSRGATVALIIGGLSDKFDYIIANSTFSKFLDSTMVTENRIGAPFAKAFYHYDVTVDNIRRRLITGSPYFFAEHLPPFVLQQGSADKITKVWHARMLEQKLKDINKSDSTYKIYLHEGKGHGYMDPDIVCERLQKFFE